MSILSLSGHGVYENCSRDKILRAEGIGQIADFISTSDDTKLTAYEVGFQAKPISASPTKRFGATV